MKMFKKAIIGAALVACAGLMAQAASAAVVAGTPFAQQVADSSGGFTMSFGNNFTTGDSGGTFDDAFIFAINSSFQSGGSVSSNFTSTQSLTLQTFNLVKYDFGTDGNVEILSTTVGSNLAPNYFTLNANNLSSGQYYIEIAGTVNGVDGGAYGGSLNVTTAVTAVPEPATYGMLLGGLGLIGFVARRKKQS